MTCLPCCKDTPVVSVKADVKCNCNCPSTCCIPFRRCHEDACDIKINQASMQILNGPESIERKRKEGKKPSIRRLTNPTN